MSEAVNGPGACRDEDARRDTRDVRHELRNHITVAEIKATNLEKNVAEKAAALGKDVDTRQAQLSGSLDEIKALMKWAGSLIITLIIGVLGWSLVQQYQANEQQKKDLTQQIQLLQEQERTRTLSIQNKETLDQLTSGTSETPAAAKR